MALSDIERNKYATRVYSSRMRLLCNCGFYGILLTHMKFAIDEGCDTAYTDGERIAFSPKFLDEISDPELDFVLMHEILHVALQHCFRTGDRDNNAFNIACDIVVNSNIKHSKGDSNSAITLKKYGVSMHLTPDGKEGYEYTAEEVYEMLKDHCKKHKVEVNPDASFDEHGKWGQKNKSPAAADDGYLSDLWAQRVMDAAKAAEEMAKAGGNGRGTLPAGIDRLIEELTHPTLDWRTILADFVSEEITDYSFYPPDRRFSDSGFFLPDLNEKENRAEDILFMVDTSGSMSDKMIAEVYSEIKGAIDQFGGKLSGWLGFFDAKAYEALPFDSVNELLSIRPKGGGGTDFQVIFDYVNKKTDTFTPAAIVILTDGYCPFPDESEAMGVPVLWIINNDHITPPWGKVARILGREGR